MSGCSSASGGCPEVAKATEFNLASIAGKEAWALSGRGPLGAAASVPGLFRRNTYHTVVLPEVDKILEEFAKNDESVLGESPRPISPDAAQRTYLEEYRKAWRAFVDGISVPKQASLDETEAVTRVLGAPYIPLWAKFFEVVNEVTNLAR